MKSIFKLIEKSVGEITYEHCVVQHLYDNIYIGDAERNFYIDSYHEVNLCVHYNVRIAGKFEFEPSYQFYLTDGRMSLKLHWSLGVPESEMVIEAYQSLDEAKSSKYYEDFCILKERIDNEIERQKSLDKIPATDLCVSSKNDKNGDEFLSLYEFYRKSENLFVQIWVEQEEKDWKVSISKESVIELFRYMDDFAEMDEKYIHCLTYLPFEKCADNSEGKFHEELCRVKQYIEEMKTETDC